MFHHIIQHRTWGFFGFLTFGQVIVRRGAAAHWAGGLGARGRVYVNENGRSTVNTDTHTKAVRGSSQRLYSENGLQPQRPSQAT